MTEKTTENRPQIRCCGCGKHLIDVRKMISITNALSICDECIDLCHEIAHEEGGLSTIATSDLEALRAKAHQADLARIWIDGVRSAVQHADAALPPVLNDIGCAALNG